MDNDVYEVAIIRVVRSVTTLRLSIKPGESIEQYATEWAKNNCIEEEWTINEPLYQVGYVHIVK